MLKRTNFYLKGIEKFVVGLERKHNKEFIMSPSDILCKYVFRAEEYRESDVNN